MTQEQIKDIVYGNNQEYIDIHPINSSSPVCRDWIFQNKTSGKYYEILLERKLEGPLGNEAWYPYFTIKEVQKKTKIIEYFE